MSKKLVKGAAAVCGLGLALVGVLYLNHDLGTPKWRLESDVRTSQKIEEGWRMEGAVSDTMAAFLSYPEEKSDHTYSIYVNHPGLSFGYLFRGGGTLTGGGKGIMAYTVEGCQEKAFFSMNEENIVLVEINDGNTIQRMEMDGKTPFALVLPIRAGEITFYNGQGAPVDYVESPL